VKNPLEIYFKENDGRIIHKWMHYFEIYHHHFQRYINKECIILEIGVSMGGSLQMWKHYFGDQAKIYGIDIGENCKQFEDKSTHIFIGSLSDRDFLRKIKEKIPKVDILIDDGGHRMDEQRITFEELYYHIKDDGIYLCEDLHTSYREEYGGGYKQQESFIEFTKGLIDHLNAWQIKGDELSPTDITRSAHSFHYYDSVFVIEKKREEPWQEMRGDQPGNFLGKNINKTNFEIFLLKLDLLGIELDENMPAEYVFINPKYLDIKFPEKYSGLTWPEDALTMIGYQRLSNIEFCLKNVIENDIKGDLIETGVWKGGACILMRGILDILNEKNRKVWVADSFQGVPRSNSNMYPDDKNITLNEFDELSISKSEVEDNFKKFDLLDDQVEFLEGWFNDTLQTAPISRLSILRLDGDLYESTIDALFYLYPKLSIGGYCIIDDWGAIEACKKAVCDYRTYFGIDEEIRSIDHDGVYWKKEKQIKTVSREKFNREVINRNKLKMQRRDRWIQVKQIIKNGIRNFVHVE